MNYLYTIPSLLSLSRILLTPVVILLITMQYPFPWLGIVVFTGAALTDLFDGKLARKHNLESDYGKFIDPLADKVLVLGMFFFFYYVTLIPLWILLLITMRDIMITGLRNITNKKNMLMQTTYFAKVKTTIQFIAIYYTLLYIVVSKKSLYSLGLNYLLNQQILYIIMLLVAVITCCSGVDYLIKNRQKLISLFN